MAVFRRYVKVNSAAGRKALVSPGRPFLSRQSDVWKSRSCFRPQREEALWLFTALPTQNRLAILTKTLQEHCRFAPGRG